MIHPSTPLFNQEAFLSEYDCGLLDSTITEIVAAITLVILRPRKEFAVANAPEYLAHQLAVTEREGGLSHSHGSLTWFQQACLLAYYAFHSCPDRRSWFRIGHLTREAYSLGLHQLDTTEPLLTFADRSQQGDQDSWRKVWWLIHGLDSHSNISAATPFVVEAESIRTAIKRVHANSAHDDGLIFLPADVGDMWETIKTLIRCDATDHFSLHIAITAWINQVAKIYRLGLQGQNSQLESRLRTLEDTFVTVRLAFPSWYLNSTRMASQNETRLQHNARLVNCIVLLATQTLLAATAMLHSPTTQLVDGWNRMLESCDRVVSVVKACDPQSFTAMDPALCLIVSLHWSLLDLYARCQHEIHPGLQAKLMRHKQILVLFLEQFAMYWYLPRFLLGEKSLSHARL